MQSNKRLCHDEIAVAAGAGSEESKVAEDNDDSEPSDNEDDGYAWYERKRYNEITEWRESDSNDSEEKVIVMTGKRSDWYLRKAAWNLLSKKNETCESGVLCNVDFA